MSQIKLIAETQLSSKQNDVRQISRDAEAVGKFTVFNIKGNEYRLIVGINYSNPK